VVDEISRSAARLALLFAVPVAVLVGLGVFGFLSGALTGGPAGGDPDPPPAAATGPVPTPERELTGRAEIVCRALLSQLPDHVRDLAQRPVTAGPEQNAAYGDPPIVVACGVPEPRVAPTALVWQLDGVCWFAQEGAPEGTVLVTVDREVPVRVTVPRDYGGPAQWAAEFNDTIVATVLSAARAPSGCEP
jgi:hypothetical protein